MCTWRVLLKDVAGEVLHALYLGLILGVYLTHAWGVRLNFLAGKDVTKKFMKKKDSSGVWKHKTIPGQSVFSFFSPVQIPDGTTAVEHTDELEEVRSLIS
jgi:hypothetical protein